MAAWVGEVEERHRLTFEGMAELTAGRIVDQADVEGWAVSCGPTSPPVCSTKVKLRWSNEAVAELARLHDLLAAMKPTAAARAALALALAPTNS